jgi:hypothetical protein
MPARTFPVRSSSNLSMEVPTGCATPKGREHMIKTYFPTWI